MTESIGLTILEAYAIVQGSLYRPDISDDSV